MKVYCYYTRGYKILFDEWFLPSIGVGYEVVSKEARHDEVIHYMKPGWVGLMREKVELVLEAIKSEWQRVFVFSDPDVQFLGAAPKDFEDSIKNKDIAFQKNHPWMTPMCAGFFVCRANERTLRFWRAVHDAIDDKVDRDDQDYTNYFLHDLIVSKIKRIFLRNEQAARKAADRISQVGLNPYRIRWGYLPLSFFNPGPLNWKVWEPGMELKLPEKIVLHHANWTTGLDNKIAQLQYVKNMVNSRSKQQQVSDKGTRDR